MIRFSLPRRRVALLAIPVAGLVLLGGAGWAIATGHSSTDEDHVAYHSSVTTGVTDDSGPEAAHDLALSKAARISLTQALTAGTQAVPGGTAMGVELDDKDGNVVYTVDVVTSTEKTQVIVDAGNGRVLARNADHDNDNADRQEQPGAQTGSSSS